MRKIAILKFSVKTDMWGCDSILSLSCTLLLDGSEALGGSDSGHRLGNGLEMGVWG